MDYKYKLEWININATDCPAKITNLETGEVKQYLIEEDAWKLLVIIHMIGENLTYSGQEEILDIIFRNFKSDK